jgi:hypothetical protein
MTELSTYEEQAREDIQRWRDREPGWLARAGRVVTRPVDIAADFALDIPVAGAVIAGVTQGAVSIANDAAQWTVRREAILASFPADHAVTSLDQVAGLDLRVVDAAIGRLDVKYRALAVVEGAAVGSAGAAGIVVDIPALMVWALRAVGEYATYCGFDTRLQHERLYAMEVLSFASSSGTAKRAALMELQKVATEVAKRATWRQLQDRAVVRALQEVAKAVGIRLTKAKLAQAVPVMGGAVAAGFNTWYLKQVCDAAYHLYRGRFLERKLTSLG